MRPRAIASVGCISWFVLALVVAGCKAQSGETPRPQDHRESFAPGVSVSTAASAQTGTSTSQVQPSRDCLGQWRLTIGAFAELEVSPQEKDSWCRSLPHDLTVELRKDPNGRPSVAGAPLQPTDVLVGAGKCEFQFDGPTTGVPANYSLTIEVPSDASADGRAKCTVWGATEDGRRSGWGMSAPTKASLAASK